MIPQLSDHCYSYQLLYHQAAISYCNSTLNSRTEPTRVESSQQFSAPNFNRKYHQTNLGGEFICQEYTTPCSRIRRVLRTDAIRDKINADVAVKKVLPDKAQRLPLN